GTLRPHPALHGIEGGDPGWHHGEAPRHPDRGPGGLRHQPRPLPERGEACQRGRSLTRCSWSHYSTNATGVPSCRRCLRTVWLVPSALWRVYPSETPSGSVFSIIGLSLPAFGSKGTAARRTCATWMTRWARPRGDGRTTPRWRWPSSRPY